jgi:hypothetical protein
MHLFVDFLPVKHRGRVASVSQEGHGCVAEATGASRSGVVERWAKVPPSAPQ